MLSAHLLAGCTALHCTAQHTVRHLPYTQTHFEGSQTTRVFNICISCCYFMVFIYYYSYWMWLDEWEGERERERKKELCRKIHIRLVFLCTLIQMRAYTVPRTCSYACTPLQLNFVFITNVLFIILFAVWIQLHHFKMIIRCNF